MLTFEQRAFLLHHDVPLDRVMDASGLPRKVYQALMSQEGLLVAYGVSACREMGHTMRTRKGHCVQCNPAALAFLKRWNESGYVYIAISEESGLCKVGTAKDVAARIRMLNQIGYGYTSDWAGRWQAEVSNAGQIEAAVQRRLVGYRETGGYISEAQGSRCMELFNCGDDIALAALEAVLTEG